MINKELNTLLHQCLDDKILEINLIELIESFIIEKHYYFRFQDHEQGEIHQGIISKSFKRKLHRKIMHSRNDYSKKIWRNIRFHPHNQIFMHVYDVTVVYGIIILLLNLLLIGAVLYLLCEGNHKKLSYPGSALRASHHFTNRLTSAQKVNTTGACVTIG